MGSERRRFGGEIKTRWHSSGRAMGSLYQPQRGKVWQLQLARAGGAIVGLSSGAGGCDMAKRVGAKVRAIHLAVGSSVGCPTNAKGIQNEKKSPCHGLKV